MVDPPCIVPYSIAVWSARSSTDSIGTSILWTVKKAARLAVYDEMMINVKAHLRRKDRERDCSYVAGKHIHV